MKELASYKNGNTEVVIMEDGTKIRTYCDSPAVNHPESIDVKITNYCDMGCPYCHESSTKKGVHGDLNKLLDVISELPAGVELAIGGGNPLAHPDLIPFLKELKLRRLIPNITINQGHLKKYQLLIHSLIDERLVYGIGISITSNNYKYIPPILAKSNNVVYHIIAGVNDISVFDQLAALGDSKFLVLGYKNFGFGVGYYSVAVNIRLQQMHKALPTLLQKYSMSFDNLAIEQLKVEKFLTKDAWEAFYMGDDFTFTMYIDAVKQEFAPTSRTNKGRNSFSDCSLLEYFKQHA